MRLSEVEGIALLLRVKVPSQWLSRGCLAKLSNVLFEDFCYQSTLSNQEHICNINHVET
jgi:hypothetical protein